VVVGVYVVTGVVTVVGITGIMVGRDGGTALTVPGEAAIGAGVGVIIVVLPFLSTNTVLITWLLASVVED
jgi:hypothetical protein